jgi:thiamine-monophosphate kinase
MMKVSHTKVSEIGEFGLIKLISEILEIRESPLLLGIGDDAAAWHTKGGEIELATTDALVENVHFSLKTISWEDLGWKGLAVNLSDIAAMGGTPKYALVSLCLPPETEVENVVELYKEMASLAQEYNLAVVGGNVTSAPLVALSITVVGETEKGKLLTRSAALPGDKIAVTGYLGASAAGLKMLTEKLEFEAEETSILKEAHFRPCPRIAEGKILVEQGIQTAIDLSDGLLSDLDKICQASKVGAKIEADKIPIHPAVKKHFGEKALELALSGGEDYELLFTGKSEILDKVKNFLPTPATVIGEITDDSGKVVVLDEDGKPIEFRREGWEHFTYLSQP